jgi:hypothetical protein
VTLTVLDDLLQGSPEWHDQRRGIVTASVVGKLLTPTGKVASNDYSRALTAQLVAERITGYTDPTFQSDDMIGGVNEEPRARFLYSERYAEARESGFMRRDEDGWTLGYSPDGLVGDDGLIEIKAPRAKKHVATVISGEVPAEHMPQIQAGLLVSGRQWLDFISFCGGLPMWVKRVYPDPRWFDAISQAAKQFETNAAEMAAAFEAAVEGLPATERIDYFQDVIV